MISADLMLHFDEKFDLLINAYFLKSLNFFKNPVVKSTSESLLYTKP